MRGYAAGDGVEAGVGEWEVVGRGDHVRLHPGRGVHGYDMGAELSEAPRNMTAPTRDVEHGHAGTGLAPRDDQVEVLPRSVRRARPVGLRPVVPEVSHAAAASSTARRAPSSIVASGWMFSRPASARICRPSSAFVPSSRTTIG